MKLTCAVFLLAFVVGFCYSAPTEVPATSEKTSKAPGTSDIPKELVRFRRQAVPVTPADLAGEPKKPVSPLSPGSAKVRRQTQDKPQVDPPKPQLPLVPNPGALQPSIQPPVRKTRSALQTLPQPNSPKPKPLPKPAAPKPVHARTSRQTVPATPPASAGSVSPGSAEELTKPVPALPSRLAEEPILPVPARVRRATQDKPQVDPPRQRPAKPQVLPPRKTRDTEQNRPLAQPPRPVVLPPPSDSKLASTKPEPLKS